MTLSPASAPPGMLVGTVYDAAYAFMMSILLLTLLSRLHCQPPPVMSRVSLLPVANVDESPVQKTAVAEDVSEQLFLVEPDSKSRVKVELLKLGFGSGFSPPLASKKFSQSGWPLVHEVGAGGHVFMTLPSSCTPSEKSWTAVALGM